MAAIRAHEIHTVTTGLATRHEVVAVEQLSPKTAVRTRGVITGIHASTDTAKMGRPVKGMITVRLRPQSREIVQGFRDFVIGLPETLQVFVTTGAEDLLVLVAVESTEALRDFVLDSLTKRREVAGIRTEVVFDHLQNHVVAPARLV